MCSSDLNIAIGGNSPVTIQSMTNTPTQDAKKTVEQILQLENEGCELVRVAVSNQFDLAAIKTIKKNIHIPLIVDILPGRAALDLAGGRSPLHSQSAVSLNGPRRKDAQR